VSGFAVVIGESPVEKSPDGDLLREMIGFAAQSVAASRRS
jgi:hypothetical protein